MTDAAIVKGLLLRESSLAYIYLAFYRHLASILIDIRKACCIESRPVPTETVYKSIIIEIEIKRATTTNQPPPSSNLLLPTSARIHI